MRKKLFQLKFHLDITVESHRIVLADEEFSYHTAFSPYHQSVDTEVTGGEGSNTKREAKGEE